jgi:lipopolysaccharide export LptBFGC system permease protein LptF
LEKSDLPPVIGVWWVHAAALALGLYLVMREARKA